MWRARPDDPVDGIRRQVGRVRARRNGWIAQRAAYAFVAVLAAAATMLLLAALLVSPLAFGVTLVVIVLGVGLAAARVSAAALRAWVRVGPSAAWVDGRAGLDGRLATLLALGNRGAPFFRALLLETTLARRAAFEPHAVVPSAIPAIALCAALAALGALGLVVRLAPALEPRPLVVASGPGGPAGTPTGLFFLRRMVAAVASPDDPASRATEPPANAPIASAGAESETRTGLANLPGALQASLRRRLWGDEWARAGSADTGGDRATQTAAAEDARARAARTAAAAEKRDAGRRATPGDAQDGDVTTAGAGAAGAGTGSDPTLFGPATTDEIVGEGRFALGLAARVRSLETGPRPPTGDAPDAAPDAHPAIATRQPPDAPAHRAAVPAAYAAIVRETFTHRAPSEGTRP
jgi:hypothetical protein